MAVKQLGLSYESFKTNSVMNPSEVNINNSEIKQKVNEVVDVLNEHDTNKANKTEVAAEVDRLDKDKANKSDVYTQKELKEGALDDRYFRNEFALPTVQDYAEKFDGINEQLAKSMKKEKIIGRPDHWEMIAIDTFEDTNNWVFVDQSGNTELADRTIPIWTVEGNKMTSSISESDDSFALFKGVKLNDGKVQVIYENPDTTLNMWSGLQVRANGKRDESLLVLIFNGNPGSVGIWKHIGWGLELIKDVQLNEIDTKITTNVPLSLECEVIGSTVKVYVNGRLMISSDHADISNFLYGECGLVADKSRAYTFSNFSIKRKRFDSIPPIISKIVCVGSSITNGYGVTKSWRERFGEKVSNELTGKTVSVINGGINGSTTTDMLMRLPALLNTHNPDMVVIETSINDTKKNNPIPYEVTLTNLRKMIKLTKQLGAIPLLTTATPIDPSINASEWDITSWQRVHQLNVRVRQLAFEENIRLIENAYAFNNNLSLIPDGLHPNDEGAQIMADTAFNTIIGKA